MKSRLILLLLAGCLLPFALQGQTHEAGGLIKLGYEKKIVKGLNFGLEGEGRFNNNFTNFDRLKLGASFNYSFFKKRFKIGISGNYLLSDCDAYFENRGRINAMFTYAESIHQFKISYRVRVQSTFYEERFNDHKFNPKTYLRNRLQLEYEFFSKPAKLYASTEFFLRLYEKQNHIVDNFRTIVGLDYRLTQGSSIGVFFRSDNEIQVKNPSNVYYIGILYNFKH